MDNKIYCIWMQKVLGVASRKAREVLDYFGSAEKFAESGEKERRLSGLFSQREIARISNTPTEYEMCIRDRRWTSLKSRLI